MALTRVLEVFCPAVPVVWHVRVTAVANLYVELYVCCRLLVLCVVVGCYSMGWCDEACTAPKYRIIWKMQERSECFYKIWEESTVCIYTHTDTHTHSTVLCPVFSLKSYKLLLWPGRRLLSLNHCDAVWVFKDHCSEAVPGYPCYYNTTHPPHWCPPTQTGII